MIKATTITPDQYLDVIKMCQDKRGIQTNGYSGNRAVIILTSKNEVVLIF